MKVAFLTAMTAFQLTCTGDVNIITSKGLETKPFKTVLQVDTRQKTWCRNDCRYVQKIYSIIDEKIVFRNVQNQKGFVDPEDRTMWFMYYQPDNNKYFELNISSGGSAILQEGKCETGPYQP